MNYNPHEKRHSDVTGQYSLIETEIKNRREFQEWCGQYDADKAHVYLSRLLRERNPKKLELENLAAHCEKLALEVNSLNEATSLGWNPLYWFSKERSAKQAELDQQQKILEQYKDKECVLRQDVESREKLIQSSAADLGRFRSYNALEDEAALKVQLHKRDQLKLELERVSKLKADLDLLQAEPLRKLKTLVEERVVRQSDLRFALEFEQRLSNASNGYERAMAHESCREKFGEFSPKRVVENIRREDEARDRSIEKLKERLLLMAQRSNHTVKILVIDGSNLCYQNKIRLGLAPLKAVSAALAKKYETLIVFDASTCGALKMSRRDLIASFEVGIRVHIVAEGQKADETLLDAADGPEAYVISNDRFADFPDKSPVSDKRIFSHEIINNKVLIRDLNFAIDY